MVNWKRWDQGYLPLTLMQAHYLGYISREELKSLIEEDTKQVRTEDKQTTKESQGPV